VRTPEKQAAFEDLTERIVATFQKADARFAIYIGLGAMAPRKALVTLARVRESWEALIPGIGERLIATKTEQAALNQKKREETAA